MALDAKQKKQLAFIVVLLVGFVFYEMHEMKKKKQKTQVTAVAPKEAEGVKNPGSVGSATPPSTAPASTAPKVSVPVVSPKASSGMDTGAFKGSKTLTPEEKALYFKRQEELAGKPWGHDPFYPEAPPEAVVPEMPSENGNTALSSQGTEASGTEPAFKLTGISKVGSTFFATINRKMLQVGESISGYRVMNIRDGGVTLQKDQRNYELRLGK